MKKNATAPWRLPFGKFFDPQKIYVDLRIWCTVHAENILVRLNGALRIVPRRLGARTFLLTFVNKYQ